MANIHLNVKDSIMNKDEILKRIGDKEDNFLERKSAGLSSSDIRRALVAFSNSLPADRNAVLFIGVDDKTGTVSGVPNSDKLQKTVRECANACYPPITNYYVEAISTQGTEVVAVVIGPSKTRPHFSGAAFVRKGSESIEASKELLDELIASRNDKVARILDHKGATATVRGMGYKLGTGKSMGDRSYRESDACTVIGCDAHTIVLKSNLAGKEFAEPLERVTIGYDSKEKRLLLEIRGP